MKTLMCLLLALLLVPALADDKLDRLADLMDGKFDTHAKRPDLPPEDRLVDQRTRVTAPALGDYVFYQQLNHGETLEVYRQRVLVLAVTDGTVQQKAYALREPEQFVDADPAVFESISMEDVEVFMPDGCEQVWKPRADGYHGYVDPERCVIISSRTGKERQIEAENVLTRGWISTAERGYDPETGEQLFGSPKGELLLLHRVGDDQ